MAVPQFGAITHFDLSVTDVERSSAWYRDVLGLRPITRHTVDGRTTELFKHDATGVFIGITEHSERTADRFDERDPGLDHLAFAVSSAAELDAWDAWLTELGVVHSPPAEDASGVGRALVFRDPDNTQLELWWAHRRGEG